MMDGKIRVKLRDSSRLSRASRDLDGSIST